MLVLGLALGIMVLLIASAGAAEKPATKPIKQPVPPAWAPAGAPVKGVQILPANLPVATATGAVIQHNVIALKEGKPTTMPTCYASSVRIRAVTGNQGSPGSRNRGSQLAVCEPKSRTC
jgi:hypothetical protein